MGHQVDIASYLGENQTAVLCCTQQPVLLENIFSQNVHVFDDSTTLMQFQQVFNPKRLQKEVDDFLRREREVADVAKSAKWLNSRPALQFSQPPNQNRSPYANTQNMFSQLLSQSQTAASQHGHRHAKNQVQAALRAAADDAFDGSRQHAAYSTLDEGTVDDLDEIDDDEDTSEGETMGESMRQFINDGDESAAQPVDYYQLNNQIRQDERISLQSATYDSRLESTVAEQPSAEAAQSNVAPQEEPSQDLVADELALLDKAAGESSVSENVNLSEFLLRLQMTRYTAEDI